MKTMTVRKLVIMAVLCALALIFALLIHFPLIPAAPFLEYDAGDIPILIGSFAFGPIAGLLMTVVVAFIQGFTVSASSGIYGVIMHIFATGSLCLTAALVYNANRTRKQAVIGLCVGSVVMTIVMVFANLWITPVFLGTSVDIVKGMIWPVFVPFNLIKAVISSVITFLLYKPLSKHVFKLER